MTTRLFSSVLILILSASLTIAQSIDKPRASFGILGGLNLQNLNGKNMIGDKMENDMITGYHVGANIQIPISPEFYFQPGILFTTKGAKVNGLITSTYNLSYIELPLNLVYKGLLGNGYVMVGFGPYIGYGIMGNTKYEGGSASIETDIEFKNIVESGDPLTTTYVKTLDAGGNIFAGYEMAGGIFIQLNTQLGLLKINPEDKRISNDKSSINNTGFGISLGYRF